jgi:2-oxoisovalerate dehydrogenase E2 component (dihydrolipoyl transacylase)
MRAAKCASQPRATDLPAVRRVLPLSLTFDHRVVTGGEAARFLNALKFDLEQPS